jgi:hypothetical protein
VNSLRLSLDANLRLEVSDVTAAKFGDPADLFMDGHCQPPRLWPERLQYLQVGFQRAVAR